METYSKPEHISNIGNEVDSFALILAGQKTIKAMLAKLLSISEGKAEEEIVEFYTHHERSSVQYYTDLYQPAKKTGKRK
jgi:hypothetical protein